MPSAALYTALSALAAAAALVKTLAYGRVLSPEEFGAFVFASLVVMLATYPATLGLQDALARELPIRRGQAKDTQALRSVSLTGIGILAGAVGSAISLVAFLWDLHPILAWCGPLLTATVWFNATSTDIQSRELSVMQAQLLFAKSAVPLVIVLAVGASWTGPRIVALETAVLVALTVVTLWWRPDGLRWQPSWREGLLLSRFGLPFMASSAMQSLALNLDRWAVQATGGTIALGYYGFAMQLTSAGLVALNVTQLYLTPRLLRQYAQQRDSARLTARLLRRGFATFAAGALTLVVVLLIAAPIVERWWPSYTPALPLLLPVGVGAVLIAMSFFDVLFLAAGTGRRMLLAHVAALITTGLGCAVVAVTGGSLFGFAIVFALGRLVTVTVGWREGRRLLSTAGAPQ